MSEDPIRLECSGFGASCVQVYVQHVDEPEQSTGIMAMEGGKILFQLDFKGVERFISELSLKWQGMKPRGLL